MSRWRLLRKLAVVWGVTIPASVRGQAEIGMRGRALDSHEQPIAGAEAYCEPPAGNRSTRADAEGSLLVRCGASVSGTWRVHLRAIGFTPRVVVVTATERRAAEPLRWVLQSHVEALDMIRVVATRSRPSRDDPRTGRQPGADDQRVDFGTGLSGELTGNPGAGLSGIAALHVAPGADGLRSIGAFGQGADQNRAMLNGIDFDGDVPRDGLRRTVRLSTYDPRVGRFSGILVTTTMSSGSSVRMRAARVSIEPGIWGLPFRERPTRRAVASLTASGPLHGPAKYANLSAQLAVAPDVGYSVLSQRADRPVDGTLSQSAIDVLRRANESMGAAIEPQAEPLPRMNFSASAVSRLDFTKAAEFGATTDGTVLYLLTQASTRYSPGVGLSPWTALSRTTRAQSTASQATLVWAPYIRSVLSEMRLAYSFSESASLPTWQAPGLNVQVSDSASNQTGMAALGGASLGTSRVARKQLLGSYDVSWMTLDRRHRFNLFADALSLFANISQHANAAATWSFASLDALAAGRADFFERSDTRTATSIHALRGSLALSDVMTLNRKTLLTGADEGRGLSVQVGLRLDWAGGGRGPSRDQNADSLFNIRTGVVPSSLRTAPMLGFTWGHGVVTLSDNGVITDTRTKVSGGVRVYRGATDPLSNVPVFQVTDQGGPRQFSCTGAAAPPVPWGWPREGGVLPDGCLAGAPAVMTTRGRSIVAVARAYEPARSTRLELKLRQVLAPPLVLTVGVSAAGGASGAQSIDKNLRTQPRFRLPDEASRPVFAPASAIDPLSGRVALGGSRVDSTYTMVLERNSGLRTRFLQPTVGVTWRARPGPALSPVSSSSSDLGSALSVSYALTDATTQVTGFVGPTSDDPRLPVWSRLASPRHALVVETTTMLGEHVRLAASLRATSGYRYTPMVATDVNGDGLPNDVAFIASSLAVSRVDDPRARRCVERQRGRLALLNSCEAGWSIAQNTVAATFAPGFFGRNDRVAVTILVTNPLAALDALVHSGEGLRGWGVTAMPDPTLLVPRTFDATRQAFSYDVSPQFGRSALRDNYLVNPFKLSVDARVTLGPPLEDEWLRLVVKDLRQQGGQPTAKDFQDHIVSNAELYGGVEGLLLLRLQTVLGLTSGQCDSLRAIEQDRRAFREATYLPVATALADGIPAVGSGSLRTLYRGAIARSLDQSWSTIQRLRDVLTAEQQSRLKTQRVALSLFMTHADAVRASTGPQLLPR